MLYWKILVKEEKWKTTNRCRERCPKKPKNVPQVCCSRRVDKEEGKVPSSIRATNDPFFKKTSKVFVSSQKVCRHGHTALAGQLAIGQVCAQNKLSHNTLKVQEM